jgi:HSP20 family protein
MTLIRRNSSPFGDLLSLRQAMDRLFEESFVPRSWNLAENTLVPLDVYTTADEVLVEASLPGIKPEEIDITIEGDTLTLSGETQSSRSEEDGSTVFKEIRRGRFARTLTLPAGLEPDKAKATFEDGILTLRIPKAEQVKPRQIKITSSGGQHEQAPTIKAK